MIGYCDGACRVSNPGECACAFAVFYENRTQLVHRSARYLGPELHTNNYAEFQGLLELLKWAETNKVRGLDIFCDSELVVRTSVGLWALKEPSLLPLCHMAYALLVRGNHVLQHVRGHNENLGNEYVDKLCNEELDRRLNGQGNGKDFNAGV